MTEMRWQYRWATWLGLLLLVLVAAPGCVSETTTGDKHVFSYQWWVPISVMLGGLVAGPAGWFARQYSGRVAFGLFVICPLALVAGVSLFTDRCEVDPAGFSGRMGFFGSKSFSGRYDEIGSMSIVTREGSRSSSDYVVYRTKDGRQDEFALGNGMTRQASELILQFAAQKGIAVADER